MGVSRAAPPPLTGRMTTVAQQVVGDRVPLTRLDNADPGLLATLMLAVERVAEKAAFTGGAEVEGFESAFAAYCGTAQVVGVSSGTEALALCLRGLGIGRGDEVLVPTNSFIATAEAVTLASARPRLVDVDAATQLLTAEIVERNITDRTSCVIPVHLYGRTVDLDPIVEIGRRRGIAVIEDACQAHGAIYKGRRVGSIGDAGCFSFYPSKNLGGWGDGGAIATNNAGLADRVRLLRSHGARHRYVHRIAGTTARLDALQAAVLRVKLDRLEEWNELRRSVARRLTELLEDSCVETPVEAPDGQDHVFHQYVVRTPRRDELRKHLDRQGVATGIHYPVPIHLTDAFAHLGGGPGTLVTAERDAQSICSLPIFPSMSEPNIESVARAVWSFDGDRR
jgi:dTDP-3-amino-3,4,6-trideoxy-alpha-D-glucose transaminase